MTRDIRKFTQREAVAAPESIKEPAASPPRKRRTLSDRYANEISVTGKYPLEGQYQRKRERK